MKTLAFDTCFNACSAAIGWHGRPGAPRSPAGRLEVASRFERMATGQAERLVPMIEEIIGESGLGIDCVERIVVTVGPGTFTGTRICVAAARALSLALGIEAYGVSTLHAMSRQVSAGILDGVRATERAIGHGPNALGPEAGRAAQDVAIAVDARREQVYFQLFGNERQEPLIAPLLLSPETAVGLLRNRATIVAGSGAAQVCEAARRAGRELTPRFEDLEPDASYLLDICLDTATVPPRPLYLRPADAKPQAGKSIARQLPLTGKVR